MAIGDEFHYRMTVRMLSPSQDFGVLQDINAE